MTARPSPDALRLAEIRARLAAIAPGDWRRAADAEGEFVEARTARGELLPIARFHPGAEFDEMMFAVDAPETVRFLLSLVDRAAARVRALERMISPLEGEIGSSSRRDHAAEVAMIVTRPAFKAWLRDVHGLEPPLTDERCTTKLRSLLSITSRRELNDDGQARARWKALRADFKLWRDRPQ